MIQSFLKILGSSIKPIYLFPLSLTLILTTYLLVLGETKTLALLKNEYLFIIALIPLSLIWLFFKQKLKDENLVNFNQNTPSFKTTLGFFLIFSVIDYFAEDGFTGMISLWFFYWIMGLLALLILENMNLYRNYKLLAHKN